MIEATGRLDDLVGADPALAELIGRWHALAPETRAAILAIARGAQVKAAAAGSTH